mgnify:CR=1 FL=1
MTDFQPKNLNELEEYLENLALQEGPICFALLKTIERLGGLSSPDVMEYVRVAQKKMAENSRAETNAVRKEMGMGALEDHALYPPLTTGDDDREVVLDPLADEPQSGANDLVEVHRAMGNRVVDPEATLTDSTNALTPAQERMARARAARQANLAKKADA